MLTILSWISDLPSGAILLPEACLLELPSKESICCEFSPLLLGWGIFRHSSFLEDTLGTEFSLGIIFFKYSKSVISLSSGFFYWNVSCQTVALELICFLSPFSDALLVSGIPQSTIMLLEWFSFYCAWCSLEFLNLSIRAFNSYGKFPAIISSM